MMICKVCSVEYNIQRNKKRQWEVGICPICREYHALFEVAEGQSIPEWIKKENSNE